MSAPVDVSPPPLLSIEDLVVSYATAAGRTRVVHGVSLDIRAGEVVALVGESGSGKTTIGQSVIGLLPENGRIDSGTVRLNGTPISDWSQDRLDGLRGARISLVPQDPGNSLNPVRTIGAQVGEIFRIHGYRDRAEIDRRVLELLTRVGLSDPELRARQYPHELSGGMRQRVGIARALAVHPACLLLDEPLSALDAQTRDLLLEELARIITAARTTTVYVTHNLSEAVRLGHQIVVLSRRPGRVRDILRIDRPLDERNAADPDLVALEQRLWAMIRDDAAEADRERLRRAAA